MNQKSLVKKYGIRPKKRLGQNFLIDKNVINKILKHIAPSKNECILEIGPGLGVLTEGLLKQGASVIAVEKDRQFSDILKKELIDYEDRLEIITQDIMRFDLKKHCSNKKIRVVGNLPYYLTTPLLFFLLEHRETTTSAVLMIQKEVADRLCASPGTSDYGRLTVALNYFSSIKKVMQVSKSCFFPQPKVDSTIIEIQFKSKKDTSETNFTHDLFLDVVRICFGQRRKNLLNCLSSSKLCDISKQEWGDLIERCQISPRQRAEKLELEDFIKLSTQIQSIKK